MVRAHAEGPRLRPHFCRLMLGNFSKRLRIPANFLKYFPNEATTSATIRGPSGDIWPVEVFKGTRNTYLQDGWRDFVKDHCLQETDFLTFRYDGNMKFTVQIFDKTSSCEREDAFVVRASGGGRKKRMRSKEIPLESNNMPKKKPSPSVISPYGQDMPLAASEMSESMWKKPDTQISILARPLNEVAGAKKKPESPSFLSEYPCFTKYILPLHLSGKSLFILPSKFSKEHLPNHDVNLVLHDPEGRDWDVKYVCRKKFFSSTGWMPFMRAHKLKQGDACTFELVGESEMNVHIFRSSES